MLGMSFTRIRISFRKLGKLSSETEKKASGWAKPHTKDKSDVPPSGYS